jgi:hypothetical protein
LRLVLTVLLRMVRRTDLRAALMADLVFAIVVGRDRSRSKTQTQVSESRVLSDWRRPAQRLSYANVFGGDR